MHVICPVQRVSGALKFSLATRTDDELCRQPNPVVLLKCEHAVPFYVIAALTQAHNNIDKSFMSINLIDYAGK